MLVDIKQQLGQYHKILNFCGHFCQKIGSARGARRNVFGRSALIFHPILFNFFFGDSGIITVILIPINPILLEKILGRLLEVPFLGSPEGPLGGG